MTGRHRLATVLAGALMLLLLSSGGSLAAFSAPILLREASLIRLQDVAADGDGVAVGWLEGATPGSLWVRVSDDKGDSFKPRFAVAGEGGAGMSLAICRGIVWAVSAAQSPGDRKGDADLLLSTRRVTGGGASQQFLTQPSADHTVRQPQIACVGRRLLAIAWLDRSSGKTNAMLRLRDQASLLPAATNKTWDLGRARASAGISVAATRGAVLVSWTRNSPDDLRLRRFVVPGGANPAIDPQPPVTMADGSAELAELGARGQKVVLAYSDEGRLKFRLSSDEGASFGDSITLVTAGSTSVPAEATSADVRGQRIVIEALRQPPPHSSVAASATQRVPYRLQSTDNGGQWSKVQMGNRGPRIGVLRPIKDGGSRLQESWHDSGTVDRLRFQHEVS